MITQLYLTLSVTSVLQAGQTDTVLSGLSKEPSAEGPVRLAWPSQTTWFSLVLSTEGLSGLRASGRQHPPLSQELLDHS